MNIDEIIDLTEARRETIFKCVKKRGFPSMVNSPERPRLSQSAAVFAWWAHNHDKIGTGRKWSS